MGGNETPRIRQQNEFSALASIYYGDIQDLRTGHKWKPLDFIISLTPLEGSICGKDSYVQIDLHIICPSQYPEEIPQIILEKSQGLAQSLLNQLHQELIVIATKQIGREMIFELCEHVREFLHKHNKPSTKSFYDEMLQRQKNEELLNQQAKQKEEDRQRENVKEEINQIYSRFEKADHESRRKSKSESDFFDSSPSGFGHSERRKKSKNGNIDNVQCSHDPIESISFDSNNSRQIFRGKCLKHSDDNRIVYNGIDEKSGESVIINEWILDTTKYDLQQINKQINNIEQEFNYITKLRHKNLPLYYNFSYDCQDNILNIKVLKEFVIGSNCQSLFSSSNINADLQFLKYIATGVLQALDYLHRKNVIHRDIKNSCIYFNNEGIVKVSNYSIHRRLTDLIQNSHPTNYGKKTDIYKFGTFLFGLIQGSDFEENIGIPISLPSDLFDFLNKCLCKDEKERFSTIQLLNHQFINQKPIIPLKFDDSIQEFQQDLENNILETNYEYGSKNQSRINTEFELIESIGIGAFGDVKKYKNKLDGRFYAIKRIKLNHKNKQLNRKILREVKLLSRLNHENIVRYYNSWIETSEVDEVESGSSRSTPYEPKVVIKEQDDFTINDNIEELAPSIKNTKITYDSKSQVAYEESSLDTDSDDDDDDDDDEDNNPWNGRGSESDSIKFENSKEEADQSNTELNNSNSSEVKQITRIDYMYIQMEFCEKSTLKSAIDENLYEDEPRVQRLFREILEGLAHIHQQGMIHRDLKPVNIFLDSRDQVKIGDFGLATTNLKSRLNEYQEIKSAIESIKEETVDESKTGHVGTPIYVAPELNAHSKAIYNEKVDIYSLGIILFEMCYRPPKTSMERNIILNKLREKEIIFPEDYEATLVGKNAFVIRWLLNHDASKRPTSEDLLKSEHIPPPILEEKEFRDLIRLTHNNPQSKGYKYLIASCFDQTVSPVQDITYEGKLSNAGFIKPVEIYYEFVKQIIIKIFRKHGGQNLYSPLLTPINKVYIKQDSVKLMTHSGGIVCIPYDLRVPFARYIVWNHISLFRRYSIEKVYREKKFFGCVPRELYECAFDIVTPTPGHLTPDGEILFIVNEIMNKLPVFKNKHIRLHLNHVLLVKALILFSGAKTNLYEKCITKLADYYERKIDQEKLLSFLRNSGLSQNQSENLFGLIFKNSCDINKMQVHFHSIIKKNSPECSQYAKTAIRDLNTIVDVAKAMGFDFDVIINPGLLFNIKQFSGMICQFVCQRTDKKNKTKIDVLAAGGRYDSMISHYKNMHKRYSLSKDISQSAVGISISLDKLATAIHKEEVLEGNIVGIFDVVVCSLGNKHDLNEKLQLLSGLSNADIRWTLLEAMSNKEIEEFREELKVQNMIILTDNDDKKVIFRSWEKDRFQEKNYTISELIDDLHKLIKRFSLENSSQENIFSRSDSKIYSEKTQSSDSIVTIIFHTSEKIPSSTKKRHEIQISSQLNDVFKRLNGQVIVLAFNIDMNIIKTLVSVLDFQTEEIFQKSVESVIERHSRYKKILGELCDVIFDHKSKPSKPFIILYSLIDSGYKLLT